MSSPVALTRSAPAATNLTTMAAPTVTSSVVPNTESAVHMNLRGLYRLQSGRYAQALPEFSSALNTVKSVIAHREAAAQAQERLPSIRLGFEFFNQDEDEEDQEMMDSCCISSSSDESSSPFLFQSPIIVSYISGAHDCDCDCDMLESHQSKNDDSFYNLVRFSSAILFNLALTYHLAALQDQDKTGPQSPEKLAKQKRKLSKALTFYKLSYTMMQDCHHDGVLETMAIANNLGHAQLMVGDVPKAKQCYEHLLSTMMFVVDAGTVAGGAESGIPTRHFDAFFHSVQTMVLPTYGTIAQAAWGAVMLYYYFVEVVHYYSVYTFVPIHSYIHAFIFTFLPSQNERTNQSKT